MQCPSCGSQVSDNTKFCPKCGSPIQNMAPQGGGYNQAPQPQPGQQPGKTKAIASLVLGIVGIVLDFFFVTIFLSAIGCVLGIVGIIMYSGAKKEGFMGGMATAGLVLSIIAVVFGAGSLLCTVCALGAAGAAGAAGGLSSM